MKQLNKCKNKAKSKTAPTLIHEDVSMSSKVIRDLFNNQSK